MANVFFPQLADLSLGYSPLCDLVGGLMSQDDPFPCELLVGGTESVPCLCPVEHENSWVLEFTQASKQAKCPQEPPGLGREELSFR